MHRLYWRATLVLAAGVALGATFLQRELLDFAALLSADGRITDPPAALARLGAALAAAWLCVPLAWLTWRPHALADGWRRASTPERLEVLAIAVLLIVWAYAFRRWGAYATPSAPGWVGPDAWHREDGPLEDMTAVCALAAAAILASVLPRLSRGARVLIGGLAFAAFVFGMEEISWGQRIFGIAGPELVVAHNRQHETNFHNFFSPRIVHQYVPVVLCTAAAAYFAFASRLARWSPVDLRALAVPPHRLLLSVGFQLLALHALLYRTAEIAEEAIAVVLFLIAARLAAAVRRARHPASARVSVDQ